MGPSRRTRPAGRRLSAPGRGRTCRAPGASRRCAPGPQRPLFFRSSPSPWNVFRVNSPCDFARLVHPLGQCGSAPIHFAPQLLHAYSFDFGMRRFYPFSGGGGKCPSGSGSRAAFCLSAAASASSSTRSSSSWILRLATSGSPSIFFSRSPAFSPLDGSAARSRARCAACFFCSSSNLSTSPRWRSDTRAWNSMATYSSGLSGIRPPLLPLPRLEGRRRLLGLVPGDVVGRRLRRYHGHRLERPPPEVLAAHERSYPGQLVVDHLLLVAGEPERHLLEHLPVVALRPRLGRLQRRVQPHAVHVAVVARHADPLHEPALRLAVREHDHRVELGIVGLLVALAVS